MTLQLLLLFTKVKIAPHVHTPPYYVKGADA